MRRSAFAPRRQNSHRSDEWKRCEPFLKWLRGRPCFISTLRGATPCRGKIVAAHFDPWGDKGTGSKVSDQAAMPLCGDPGGHHDEQHRIGWPAFQARYEFDGRSAVEAYWREWLTQTPMGVAWAQARKLEAVSI